MKILDLTLDQCKIMISGVDSPGISVFLIFLMEIIIHKRIIIILNNA